jgi:3-methyladenine DNA glycosylase AlkD
MATLTSPQTATLDVIMDELKSKGNESYKKIFIKHGAKEPLYGVKVEDLKKIQRNLGKDYDLAMELYRTGNSDAQYLAALVADERKMRRKDLNEWVKGASWYMLSEYAVAWVAAESVHGWEMGLEWIDSKDEQIATAGWASLSHTLALTQDEKLDKKQIEALLKRVATNIHQAQNRVRYTMNGFVIAVGSYYLPLKAKAVETAKAIGKVSVDMGGTACKVPDAIEYIDKVHAKGKPGVKKKTVRC